MGLVAAIDRDQVRREGLDLSAIAKSTRVDAANADYARRKGGDEICGLAIIADHQDIRVDAVDIGVQQQHRRNMVESPNHLALGQDRGGLLSGRALCHRQCECTLLVEAKWVDAVHNDLPGKLIDQAMQQLRMPIPRHSNDDNVALRCAVLIRKSNDAAANLICNALRSRGITRSDDDSLPRHRQSARKSTTLLTCSAENSDGELRNIALLWRVTLRISCVRRHSVGSCQRRKCAFAVQETNRHDCSCECVCTRDLCNALSEFSLKDSARDAESDYTGGTVAVAKKAVKKAPARKTAAKKAVKKAPARKTAVKRVAKKAPVRKTAAKKAPARKTAVKKAVKKAPVRKTAAKKAVKKAPVRKTAAKKAVKKAPARKTAVKRTVKKAPVRKTAAKKAVKKAPVRKTAVKRVAKKAPARKAAR